MVHLRGAVPVRDEALEQKLIHQLRDELNLLPGHRTTFQGQEQARFAEKLRTWRGAMTGDAKGLLSPNAKLVPQLSVRGDAGQGRPNVAFDLSFRVEGGRGELTIGAEAVVRAWQDGLGLVPIEGGGWAPLPREWLAKHGQQVADLLAARGEGGTVANHALPELAAL